MSLGEVQASSWAASGWESRSFLVRFLYTSSALSIISWELHGEAVVS